MSELHKLAQAMCSIDLIESHWTQELRRLPVPDLLVTVDRYLASLKAVLAPNTANLDDPSEVGGFKPRLSAGLSEEQRAINLRQFEKTEQIVRQFMSNEGPQLQRDLKEYANKCQNWATEYWLQDMYLSNPLPLPVNSNPFFMFPRQQFASSEEMLMFATRIIQFSVDFKFRIDQQTLRQDFGSGHGKGKPLCMETYKNFFHSYRMPHEDMDRLLPQSRRSNHIVVASCNQFYILRLGQDPLDNPYRKDPSSQLNESSIFDQLLRIYRVSREHAKRDLLLNRSTAISNHTRIEKVGLFTTENRKTWAKLHKRLNHQCKGSCKRSSSSSSNQQDLNSKADADCVGNQHNPNIESLRQIEDCLFVMCLDSLVHPTPLASFAGSSPPAKAEVLASGSSPISASHASCPAANEFDVRAANIILTGGGCNLFTANRWFDKFLQIIVGRDGICGINIEHSASEGITVLRFLEDFLEFLRSNPISEHHLPAPVVGTADSTTLNQAVLAYQCSNALNNNRNINTGDKQVAADSITSSTYVEPKSPNALLKESDKITPLVWKLDQQLQKALDEAEFGANKLIESFSLYILNFSQFGRSFIKSQNLSPDAFIQLALQYTFFKLHGFLVSTYESASLRQFRLGRVDNIRANTCDAYDWILAMLTCSKSSSSSSSSAAAAANQNQDQQQLINPLRRWTGAEASFIKAITKQVEILRYTIVGGAPDNHLLALKQLANIRYDDELPELFTDQSYTEFNNFRLSTSQLPNESGITVGYGAVTRDGYGCSYNPCAERIVFCISSFADYTETSSSKFAETLQESLLEMQELCLDRTLASNNNNKE